jgi:hypothetical protein
LAAGFNMFVPKPVESSELIIAIANLADVRRDQTRIEPDILASTRIG